LTHISQARASASGPAKSRPSLDESSARRIGKAQLVQFHELMSARAERKYAWPRKRHAWLRHAETICRQVLGSGVLVVQTAKRHIDCVGVQPFKERPGWALLLLVRVAFDKRVDHRFLATLSAHAVARLMERSRDTEAIPLIVKELLPWSFERLCEYGGGRVLVPTASGHFTAEEDAELPGAAVFTTWLPDRLLGDDDAAAIVRMRAERRFGHGAVETCGETAREHA
jgi:hypothetical protein